jgi:hypothetical protein
LVENDFIPGMPSSDGRTPSLAQLIAFGVEGFLKQTHTWMPAAVVAVQANNHVSVQPLIMDVPKSTGVPVPLPVLPDVMVLAPRGSLYGVKLPIAVGDLGGVFFCEKSLDVWSNSLGAAPVDPLDQRHHALSDAVFVPGLYPFTQPIPAPQGARPDELVVYNAAAQIYLQPGGQFKITNTATTAEAMALLLQTLQQLQTTLAELSTATTATMLGPMPLSAAPAFAAQALAVSSLITQMTTLVGV